MTDLPGCVTPATDITNIFFYIAQAIQPLCPIIIPLFSLLALLMPLQLASLSSNESI